MNGSAFDGLAEAYDKHRPRYPEELFIRLVDAIPSRTPVVVDAGAGTGIGLEGLRKVLPTAASIHAIDVSADMVAVGRRNLPDVDWRVGKVEEELKDLQDVDVVMAAQAYQWMDRPLFLRRAADALVERGVCAILENNRDHRVGLAAAYEDLLERRSPGYSRDYRAFDISAELADVFAPVSSDEIGWSRPMTAEEFLEMSRSSTQAQRAIAATGGAFLEEVLDLCQRHTEDEVVQVAYCSHVHIGVKRTR
jgi:SAM-dependent methyltransferase